MTKLKGTLTRTIDRQVCGEQARAMTCAQRSDARAKGKPLNRPLVVMLTDADISFRVAGKRTVYTVPLSHCFLEAVKLTARVTRRTRTVKRGLMATARAQAKL